MLLSDVRKNAGFYLSQVPVVRGITYYWGNRLWHNTRVLSIVWMPVPSLSFYFSFCRSPHHFLCLLHQWDSLIFFGIVKFSVISQLPWDIDNASFVLVGQWQMRFLCAVIQPLVLAGIASWKQGLMNHSMRQWCNSSTAITQCKQYNCLRMRSQSKNVSQFK